MDNLIDLGPPLIGNSDFLMRQITGHSRNPGNATEHVGSPSENQKPALTAFGQQ
jgi:hypothetical protein